MPERRELRIAIIGAGPGGLCMGIRLEGAGFERFEILEKAGGVGGTWYHNRYPGCACDIPAHLYSFSFEIKRDWSRPYAPQPEILAYLEHCAAKYGLLPHCRFGDAVQRARWDETAAEWKLELASGRTTVADVVVSAVGMFNEIAVPRIAGLDAFDGTVFHSARWNAEHDLTGERVGVIGSAASAVQLVPEIVKQACPRPPLPAHGELDRSEAGRPLLGEAAGAVPHRSRVRGEGPQEPLRLARRPRPLRAGALRHGGRLPRRHGGGGGRAAARAADAGPSLGRDAPALLERLVPGLQPAEPRARHRTDRAHHAGGIATADGRERELDTLILATGFAATRFLSTIDVTGRGGLALADAWSEGAQAYKGVTTAGFPNLFMLYGPNTNADSIITMIEYQADHVLRQIQRIAREGLAWIDVKPAAMAAYNAEIQRKLAALELWQTGGSGYYRAPSGRIVTQWPGSMPELERALASLDEDCYEAAALGG